jgi:hypothetical protein
MHGFTQILSVCISAFVAEIPSKKKATDTQIITD